jgi:hypothetical protein
MTLDTEGRSFWATYRREREKVGQNPVGWVRALMAVALAAAVGLGAVRAGGWSIVLGLAFLALAATLVWLLATRRW